MRKKRKDKIIFRFRNTTEENVKDQQGTGNHKSTNHHLFKTQKEKKNSLSFFPFNLYAYKQPPNPLQQTYIKLID